MSEKILPNHPWLLCIHNIPPKPSYLRAKAARRLAALGAVPLINAGDGGHFHPTQTSTCCRMANGSVMHFYG